MAVLALVIIVAFSTTAYLYLKPIEAASQPIEAIPLVLDSAAQEEATTTIIAYADFDISIPNVPSVTDVSDTVSLQIDFAAEPA